MVRSIASSTTATITTGPIQISMRCAPTMMRQVTRPRYSISQPSLQERILIIRLKQGWIFASSKTSFGIAITGILTKRKGNSDATATWLGPDGGIDSSIKTLGTTDYRLVNAAVNLNMKHSFSKNRISVWILTGCITISITSFILATTLCPPQQFLMHQTATFPPR